MDNKIIGHGDLASVLHLVKPKGLTFFASGVSNSREINEDNYRREERLLLSQNQGEHLVYFSSLCVLNSETRYAVHKKKMENHVRYFFNNYTIVRLGNITWGKNPNTIINYFRNKIISGEKLDIQEGYRHLVDEVELIYWMNLIPFWNCELNITGKLIKISDIPKEISAGRL